MQVSLLNTANPTRCGSNASVYARLKAVNFNTGNMCFLEGARRTIACDREVEGWEELGERDETVVLCLANFIRPNANLDFELHHLRRAKIRRAVLVGVGAQADAYSEEFRFSESLNAFLSFVADRSTTIGVRGAYSAELLARNGFKATQIIGCPSAFLNGHSPAKISAAPITHIGVTATPTRTNRALSQELYEIGMARQAPYFLQGEVGFSILHDDNITRQDVLEECERALLLYAPPGSEPAAFRNWLKVHSRLFFSLNEWCKGLQSIDLLIGTRIHGAILALSSGTRAAIAACDARTGELAAYLNIPRMSPDGVKRIAAGDLSDPFTPHNYLAAYADRLNAYMAFLRVNNLPCRLDEDPSVVDAVTCPSIDLNSSSQSIDANVGARQLNQIRRDAEAILGFDAPGAIASLRAADGSMAAAVATQNARTYPWASNTRPASPAIQIDPDPLDDLIEAVYRNVRALATSLDLYVAATEDNPYFIMETPPADIDNTKFNSAKLYSSRLKMMLALNGSTVVQILPVDPDLLLAILDLRKDLNFTLIGSQRELPSDLPVGRVRHIFGEWQEVLPELALASVDHVVFESPLTEPLTTEFLQSSKRLLKPGGQILLGNYTLWSIFEGRAYGVVQAVNAFLKKEDFFVSHFVMQRYGYNMIVLQQN